MVKVLEWDSNFFELKVGSLNVKDVDTIDRLELLAFDLVYFFSEKPLDLSRDTELSKNVKLTDIKLVFEKQISEEFGWEDSISSVFRKEDIHEGQLIDLSFQSGIYSRFKTDKHFGNTRFEKLFSTWIMNSVAGSLAEEVLVYNKEESYAGMVTISIKNELPNIGLIAVDTQYRGLGIARSLIRAAENWVINSKHRKILQVATQLENEPACHLYRNCGFTEISRTYIYHFWNPRYNSDENPI